MTFKEECRAKFLKGAVEHKQDWRELDHMSELRSELQDIYNYSTGLMGTNPVNGNLHSTTFLRWVFGAKLRVFVRMINWWAKRI